MTCITETKLGPCPVCFETVKPCSCQTGEKPDREPITTVHIPFFLIPTGYSCDIKAQKHRMQYELAKLETSFKSGGYLGCEDVYQTCRGAILGKLAEIDFDRLAERCENEKEVCNGTD